MNLQQQILKTAKKYEVRILYYIESRIKKKKEEQKKNSAYCTHAYKSRVSGQ